MLVVNNLEEYRKSAPLALTMGSYDGVHLAHAEIITALVREAKERQCLATLMTFDPHPRMVLNKDPDKLKLLSSNREKRGMLEALGLDILFVVPFDKEFSNQTAAEFLGRLVQGMGVAHLVIGYNHRFGKDREGDYAFFAANDRTMAFYGSRNWTSGFGSDGCFLDQNPAFVGKR